MRKGFTLIELMIVIAIIAIIAAIAIPNLMESRVTANEAAAGATLKSGVFPGEVQFQSGGYQDIDVDNVGEYGTLGALSGQCQTVKLQFQASNTTGLKLLQGPLANGGNWSIGTALATPAMGSASGYYFTSFAGSETNPNAAANLQGVNIWWEGEAAPLPAGGAYTANPTGGYYTGVAFKALIAAPVFPAAAGNTAANGQYFLITAAPQKYGDTGRRVFAMVQDGQIRSPAKVAAINLAFMGNVATVPTTGVPMTNTHLAQAACYALDSASYSIPAAPVAPSVLPTVNMFDTNAAGTKQAGTAYWEIYSK